MITDDFQKVLSRVWYTWPHIATHGPQCLRTNQIGLNCLSVLCSQHTVCSLTASSSHCLGVSAPTVDLFSRSRSLWPHNSSHDHNSSQGSCHFSWLLCIITLLFSSHLYFFVNGGIKSIVSFRNWKAFWKHYWVFS